MTQWSILYPLVVQVAMTFGLMFWMGVLRVRAVRGREVRASEVALGQNAWPEQATKVGNSFSNQFQLPVLFYLLVVLALMAGAVSGLLIILAWLFVIARLGHAWVHVTSNDLGRRFMIFLAGAIALVMMWLVLSISLAFGSAG